MTMTYAAVDLRESIVDLFDEAAQRSRYAYSFEERERFQIIRPALRALPNNYVCCDLCHAVAPDHRCPGY
jgi:hypothetical protein